MSQWSVSGRHLLRSGAPWFLLGDTAWELFRRLRVDEANHYLRTRAAQGFNVVLAVALSEFDGLRVPNVEGHVPFHDLDPDRPDERYWRHVDRVVELANGHGITVGVLPTWGSNWHDEPAFFTPDAAQQFGWWLARRYRDRDVIWVLGGDRPISTSRHRAAIEAFADGINEQVGRRHLRRLGEVAGVPDVHAHRWRHSFAHEWKLAGGDTGDLMLLLGWSSDDMPVPCQNSSCRL